MSNIKLKDGIVCSGAVEVKSTKNGRRANVGRTCSIVNNTIVTSKGCTYQNFIDDKFMETVRDSVFEELETFSNIQLPDSEISTITELCRTEMLKPVGSRTRSYEQLIKAIVYRTCLKYLRPNIYLDKSGKLSMNRACLSSDTTTYPNIGKMLTITETSSMTFLGECSNYFDSIEIDVGYSSKFSREMIKKYISMYKTEVYEFVYDGLFMTILKRFTLWEKVPDILEIIRFLKLERVQLTRTNLLVFKFVIKDNTKK